MSSVTRSVDKGSRVETNETEIRGHLDEVVRQAVEETLNSMPKRVSNTCCTTITNGITKGWNIGSLNRIKRFPQKAANAARPLSQ